MFESESNRGSESVREVARRQFFRRCRRWLLYIAMVAPLLYVAYHLYGLWHEDHLAKQARAFLEKRDYKSALLTTRRLLQIDDRNPVGCRVMAEMAKLAGRSEAIPWAARLATVEPKTDNQLLLASTALQFGQLKICRDAIERIPQSSRNTWQWHQLAGALALANRDTVTAEKEFAAAVALAPTDTQLVLNLATIRLKSADNGIAENARKDLLSLTKQSSARLQAWRALTADATARQQHPTAEEYGEKLKELSDGTFGDKLLYLEACQGTARNGAALEEIERVALANSAASAELLTWMNRHDLAKEALNWSHQFQPSFAQTQPIPLAIAESYSCARDWIGLRDFVAGKNWGNFECLRLAVASHAARRLNDLDTASMESETLWRNALKAAQSHHELLGAIAQLVEGWGYDDYAEEAWWALANGAENPKAGLIALNRHYQQKRNTYGLLRVAKRAYELNPDDLVAANNSASLGLLLKNDTASRRLAEKLHTDHPRNSAFAVTYAFALYTEGKSKDSLKVMTRLRSEQLHVPAVAAYYVVMLVDNGELERAREFVDAAKKANLLPEEQRLFAAATKKLI